MSAPRKLTRFDAAVALVLGLGYALVLLKSVGTLGYARDEGFYFSASWTYGQWFQDLWNAPKHALARATIDAYWVSNHEHPALMKSLFGLSNLLLQKKLHLFAMEGTSFRFPAMLLAGGLIGLVYLWGAEARSRAAGGVAAVSLAAMPRFFFHAHLACFDVPIVALWTLCAYAFWKALRTQGWRWPLVTGIVFGLALDTKHNSWFLPIVFVAHTVGTALVARGLHHEADRLLARAATRRALAALGAMAVLGPLLLVGLWPWIWHDTLPRLREYAQFHLNHEYYNMELFGVTYFRPPMPRSYAFVMTVATVPGVTLLLFAAGLAGRARLRLREAAWLLLASPRLQATRVIEAIERVAPRALHGGEARRGPTAATELLWALSIGAIYAAWLSPKTPIFGGTKHWMTAYPFLALFAGVGFDDVVRAARAQAIRWRKRFPALVRRRAGGRLRATLPALAVAVAALVLPSPVVQTARSHPWGLTSYTPLVGGASGAATLGLNRTFWGYATGSVAEYLDTAPLGSMVFIHDTAQPAWDMLIHDKRIRKDLRSTLSVEASSYAVYHHEMHMAGVEQQIWIAYETRRPDKIEGLDGVPVVWVYRREK